MEKTWVNKQLSTSARDQNQVDAKCAPKKDEGHSYEFDAKCHSEKLNNIERATKLETLKASVLSFELFLSLSHCMNRLSQVPTLL